jgi:zinc protease
MTMNRMLFRCLLLLMLLPCSLLAAPPKKVASVEGITEYRFDNGLRALLFPDASQSKVTVNLTVLVGSRQEGYGETGMAHLLEHMVFKGTPRHAQIPKMLQEHGADFNGSTSSDRVNYYETLVANDENLEFALDLEADRLVNSTIKKEDLDSEMTVVRNEFERGENSPVNILRERISEVAYDWHNYGKPTIGSRSDIERVPVENLRAFYQKFYQPDNVVLIVAGNFEEAKAVDLIQKYFGAIPRPKRTLENTYTEEPPQDGERMVTLRRVGDLGAVGVAYHVPAAAQEDSASLQVLANILSTQPSGRLYKALVETRKASSVSASGRSQHDPGLLTMFAQVTRDSTVEEVRDIVLSVVENIGTEGVTTQEVTRAQQQILRARDRAAADTARLGVSLSEWVAQGDWRLYFLDRDRLEKVTPQMVQAAAKRYLQRNNRTVGLFIPASQPERATVPPTPDLAALFADYHGRPAAAEGEVLDPAPDKIEARVQRSELPEGIKVTLLPKKTRGQVVHLVLTLHYGNEQNLKGFESAADFLPELMTRGTKDLSQQELRDALDKLSATLSGSGALGQARFGIQAKRDTLPDVLDLLRQVLREPTLPGDQFEVLKRREISSLLQSRTQPATLANLALARRLTPYPADDVRYIPTIDESLDRLRNVSSNQVAQLYHEYLGSQAGELTIVGDFDPAVCLARLKTALAGWRASKPYARIATPILKDVPGDKQVINTPDMANAVYNAGMLMPLRDDDADYPALILGNYILGSGTLSSRLGIRIRQKDGLSYGVTSALSASALDTRADFRIQAICNPTNMMHLETDVQEELARLLESGVTATELTQAKQGYLQAQKVARGSDSSLASQLGTLRYEGRDMLWRAKIESAIADLTTAQVVSALQKHLDPKKLSIITAGDFGAPPAR